MKKLTQKKLRKLFDYDKETGVFTRLIGVSYQHKKGTIAGGFDKSTGYIVIRIAGKLYYAHRLAWLYLYGDFPKNQIDHINHNKCDNSENNLRNTTQGENMKNASKYSNNKSGITGVIWNKREKRWKAWITVDSKQLSLGTHTEFHEAVNARKNAEVLYGFHKNHGKDL